MWTLHTKNDDHWVPLSTIASFQRMKPWVKNPNSTEPGDRSVKWLAECIRKGSKSLEVDEEGVNVKRATEVRAEEC